MTKRMVLMVLALTLVFGGVFGWKAVTNHFMGQYFATFQPPPEAVETATVTSAAWHDTIEAVGTVRAVAGIDVSNEVAGVVKAIAFESGAVVEQGTLLVQLDDAVDRAELAGFMAEHKLAQLSLRRDEAVAEKKLVSVSDLDTTRTRLEETRALVDRQRELVAKKAIRAPFAGRLGIRRVDPGQYLAAGTALVSLTQLDPVYVEFSVPEQELGRVREGLPVAIAVGTWPDRRFEGTVTAVETRVNAETRNVRVQATLANPDGELRPGMFANVTVLLPEQPEYPTVPRTALTYSLYGDFIYVVEENGSDDGEPQFKALQRFVKPGPIRDGKVAIIEGVELGEQVITAGQFKLHDGAAVAINNP